MMILTIIKDLTVDWVCSIKRLALNQVFSVFQVEHAAYD